MLELLVELLLDLRQLLRVEGIEVYYTKERRKAVSSFFTSTGSSRGCRG